MKIQASTRLRATNVLAAAKLMYLTSDGTPLIPVRTATSWKGHAVVSAQCGPGYSMMRVGRFSVIIGVKGMLAAETYSAANTAEFLKPSMENCNIPESPYYDASRRDRLAQIEKVQRALIKFGHPYADAIRKDAATEGKTLLPVRK